MTSRTSFRRLVVVGATALLALSTAACAESTHGVGSRAGAAPAGASGGAAAVSGAATPGQPAQTVAELASQLIAGTAHGTSVHMSLATTGAGTGDGASLSFEGDMRTKDGGALDAFSFDVGAGAVSLSMVYLDGTAYVKLPAEARSDPAKPWTKVTDSSTNPVAKAMAAAFDQIDAQTSLSQYATLVKGAKNFAATGDTEAGGVKAQGYAFDIDPTTLPNAKQFGADISKIGPIPTTLAVDDQGRPVQLTEKVTVGGTSVSITLTFTDYGKAVDISAPPADQTSSD